MREKLSIYVTYVKIFFKSRSEYRVAFIAGIFAKLFCYLVTFLSFWIITNRFGDIAGWNFADMSILYGLNLFTYSLAGTLVWYNVFALDREITTGRFDLYLTRPMNLLGQMICSRFGDTFIGQIIVTLFFLIQAIAYHRSRLSLSICIFILLTIIGGVMIQTGAMILIGALSFWTMRTGEIGDVFYYNLRELTHYPLLIYPKWIQYLLTFLFPWAFINYYPSLIILGKAESGFEQMLGYLSPLVGAFVLSLGIFVFYLGLRRYASAGN